MTDTAMPRTAGWRATSLAHQPVVNITGGETVGQVADLIFDPAASTVTGLLVAPQGRNAALLETARRTFGGTMGLVYVDLDHVLSLNSDVVTTELREQRAAPRGPLPRLSGVLRFDVITLQGRRLGRLVDLLLDVDGRRIVGYLVEPSAPSPDTAIQAASPVAPSTDGDLPEMGSVEPATTPATPISSATPSLLVIGSDQGVRVGRDLIIVAGRQTASQAPANTSFAPRDTIPQGTGQPAGQVVTETEWQVYDPDAPTEQMHR